MFLYGKCGMQKKQHCKHNVSTTNWPEYWGNERQLIWWGENDDEVGTESKYEKWYVGRYIF